MEVKSKSNKEENVLKYVGPSSLKEIEARLLEIAHEKPMRIHNLRENYSGSTEDVIEGIDIAYLDTEKLQLQLKRQFILDERNGWKAETLRYIATIVVSVITAYLVFILATE
ncbi:hypothetical protein IID24_04780 [Patescibacteria group bacterium]|nr:hypothetical protein [Patescibacteria group bacterium]